MHAFRSSHPLTIVGSVIGGGDLFQIMQKFQRSLHFMNWDGMRFLDCNLCGGFLEPLNRPVWYSNSQERCRTTVYETTYHVIAQQMEKKAFVEKPGRLLAWLHEYWLGRRELWAVEKTREKKNTQQESKSWVLCYGEDGIVAWVCYSAVWVS